MPVSWTVGTKQDRSSGRQAGNEAGRFGTAAARPLRPVAGESRYFVVTHWADDAAFEAWRDGSGQAAHAGERAQPVASGADLLEFEVVLDVAPQG